MSQPQTLSLKQAAALLGRSERFVGVMRERGYVETPAPGQYPLVGLVRGVIAYYEDLGAKQAREAGEATATEARTREIEMRTARRVANLISLQDTCEVLDEMAQAVAHEMRKIPAAALDDPDRQAKLVPEIAASLERVAKLTTAAKSRLAEGTQ